MSQKAFVPLRSLTGQAPSTPAEVLAEIRRIYFETTKQTIQNDFAHAVELVKSLPDEETRERATVYMEGLAQMRNDWLGAPRKSEGRRQKAEGRRKFKGRK